MHVSKKNISLTVGQTKKVPDIIVSLSIPFKNVSPYYLKSLKNTCIMKLEHANNEVISSCVAFALYEHIRDKLSGSGLEVFKNKVSDINCESINGNLSISWHTQGTGTSIRKTCGVAMTCMNPAKLFTKTSENVKFLTGKGCHKEEALYVANELAHGIKKTINISVVGKINTDKDKLEDILDVIVKKLPDVEITPAKDTTSPSKEKNEYEHIYPMVKCSGLEAAVVADYIRNNSNGMSVQIHDEGVVVFNTSWETKHKQLKDKQRIKDYVNKKYAKLEDKDELSPIFAYFTLSEGFIDANIAKRIIGTKMHSKDMSDMIGKCL
jgi:hypothetical protein